MRTIFNVLLLVLVVSCFLIAGCETGTTEEEPISYQLSFYISDGNTALQNVSVSLTGTNYNGLTDAEGAITFSLGGGSYDYQISLAQYVDYSGSVTISDSNNSVDIQLQQSLLSGTFTEVYELSATENVFGVVFYDNKYYSSSSNNILMFGSGGTADGVFTSHSAMEFNCGSDEKDGILYAMGWSSDSSIPQCNIVLYDLSSGQLEHQVNIQPALDDFKASQAFSQDLGPADITYHQGFWYMSVSLVDDQDSNFILKFDFDETFSSIDIIESFPIDFENNGLSISSLTSDDDNLWTAVNGYFCQLDDSMNLKSRYMVEDGLNLSGSDYDSHTSEFIIYSYGESVYRWSPDSP
jgi:hypothetical protein